MQNFKPRPTGKSPTLSDLEGCLSERASLSSSSRFPLSAFAWVLGLAWPDRRKWEWYALLSTPQLSRSYKHVLFRLLSRRCISTFRDRAMQHTLTPAIYLNVQTDRVKLYLEHRSAWNILFTDEHEHLNILIIFLSAQVTFTPALSDEKVHWKQDNLESMWRLPFLTKILASPEKGGSEVFGIWYCVQCP